MKSVVLLSSGLDSSVNLFSAFRAGTVKLVLTFNYGQKAASQEIASAKKLCAQLSVPHQILELPFFNQFSSSSLIAKDKKLPTGKEVSIDDMKISEQTAKSVWVPNRNGIFLNIAAGFAEALGAEVVIPGFNKEEAATFPDNSFDYMKALDHSFSFSTANKVQVQCFTAQMSKIEIVKKGEELKVPWSMVWPCYESYEKWCGQCESCQRAKRAFKEVKVDVQKYFLV